MNDLYIISALRFPMQKAIKHDNSSKESAERDVQIVFKWNIDFHELLWDRYNLHAKFPRADDIWWHWSLNFIAFRR